MRRGEERQINDHSNHGQPHPRRQGKQEGTTTLEGPPGVAVTTCHMVCMSIDRSKGLKGITTRHYRTFYYCIFMKYTIICNI